MVFVPALVRLPGRLHKGTPYQSMGGSFEGSREDQEERDGWTSMYAQLMQQTTFTFFRLSLSLSSGWQASLSHISPPVPSHRDKP